MSTSKRKKLERQAKMKAESQARKNPGLIPKTSMKRTKEFKEYVPSKSSYIRDTKYIPSLHSTKKSGSDGKSSPEYTGDYIIGLATTHKSNIVPVGRGDSPEEYAKMRRN
jgi:hypothetical protein